LWPSIHPANNEYPHAPWWHWEEGVQKNWMYNPSVELAALLIHWTNEESKASEIGWKVIGKAVNYLMKVDEMDRHQINNYQQFMKIVKEYEPTFNAKSSYTWEEVSNKIFTLVEDCIEKDVASWSTGYKPLPLDFIDSPEHPLAEKLSDLVEQNLQFYIDNLLEEGVWDISWEWASYPNEFAIARRNWMGILTVDRYKILRNFDCLER
jgi:hypothetical protein